MTRFGISVQSMRERSVKVPADEGGGGHYVPSYGRILVDMLFVIGVSLFGAAAMFVLLTLLERWAK